MQSIDTSLEALESKPATKPGSARGRKTTPRSRGKKKEEKRTPTRRRASPRHRERHTVKEQEPKKETEEEQLTVEETQETEVETKVETQEEEVTEGLPPSQDQELRRTFLQRIYRQLQSTHPNQDDAVIRQIATNTEMEICQKSTSRDDYLAALDQEIHKLMQFEMAQAKTPTLRNETQDFEDVSRNNQVQNAVSTEMHREHAQAQITQSRHYEYAQALAKAQADGGQSMMSTPDQSMSDGDGSFVQSLMASQRLYGRSSMQQQQEVSGQGASVQSAYMSVGGQYYPTSSATSGSNQSYAVAGEMTGQSTPRTMMEAQQLGNFQVQQHSQQPSSIRYQQGYSTLQEFTRQVQHFDKSTLIELLWNQRNSLAQWQRRANQLELQLAGLKSAANSMRNSGLNSSYSSPIAAGSPFVNPSSATEAEIQRARDRNNARSTYQQSMAQYTYGQQHGESNDGTSRGGSTGSAWGTHPQIYWEKIRALKTAHSGQLLIAHRALANHNAPPDSSQSVKAQYVKNNIVQVLNLLNEPPKAIQPRSFEMLISIERFIQATVIPIVRKAQSSGLVPSMTAGSQAMASRGIPATVATYTSGVPQPLQQSPAGIASSYNVVPENQYPGPRWMSPSTQFSNNDSVRQSEVTNTAQGIEGGADNHDMATPERLGHDMPSNENSQRSHIPADYTPMDSDRGGETIAAVQMEACQVDGGAGRRSTYEASTTASEGSPDSTLPASETRPTSRTELHLSSDITSSLGSSTGGKMMDAANVEDSLNDFDDFPELDFDDPLQSTNFVKENNPSNGAKKRGIEEV